MLFTTEKVIEAYYVVDKEDCGVDYYGRHFSGMYYNSIQSGVVVAEALSNFRYISPNFPFIIDVFSWQRPVWWQKSNLKLSVHTNREISQKINFTNKFILYFQEFPKY